MMNSPSSTTFTWKIKHFSLLVQRIYKSKIFVSGGEKWHIVVNSRSEPDYLSIYLCPVGWENYWNGEIEYSLKVINQINPDKTRCHARTFRRFRFRHDDRGGCKTFMLLNELHDPKSEFIVNDTCIVEAGISVRMLGDAEEENWVRTSGPPKLRSGGKLGSCMLGDAKEETVVQASATGRFEIEEAEDLPMIVTNTRTSSIAPPPTNLPKPSSTLKNRSNIASTMLHVFMSEFESNTPTYDKFGKVMEDLRASMYGGNMGDIFEEWRPRILEIEALLAAIEDLEQECKDEAPLQDELSKLVESLAQFGEASSQAEERVATSLSMLDSKRQELKETQKRLSNLRLQMEELRLEMVQLLASESNIQEYISSEVSTHAKAISEKEEADKEIKKLKQNKEDVMKNIEAIRDRTEAQRTTIAEKKALVQEWLSNPSLSTKSS